MTKNVPELFGSMVFNDEAMKSACQKISIRHCKNDCRWFTFTIGCSKCCSCGYERLGN